MFAEYLLQIGAEHGRKLKFVLGDLEHLSRPCKNFKSLPVSCHNKQCFKKCTVFSGNSVSDQDSCYFSSTKNPVDQSQHDTKTKPNSIIPKWAMFTNVAVP